MKELQYRTYDDLLAAVLSDFKTYDQEGLIDPQDLIKVAESINTELSVRIHSTKETTLDIDKGKIRLPSDVYLVNFALLCAGHTEQVPVIRGTHTEDVLISGEIVPSTCEAADEPRRCHRIESRPDRVRFTECGSSFGVVQHFKYETRTWRHFTPIHIRESQQVSPYCFNIHLPAERSAYIKGGWLYTNFDTGTVYINYAGNMEDEDGNLLVLDHPIVNTYYEYALKERILENMIIDGEQVAEVLKLISARRRNARLEAHSVVFTPDFAELKAAWALNRKKQHEKYYRMFQDVLYAA